MRNISLTILSIAFICFAISSISQAKEPAAALKKQKSSPTDFQVTSLQFDNQHKVIANRFGQLQLIVTGKNKAGELIDLTRKVTFQTSPANRIKINNQGIVTPISAGKVTITATAKNGQQATGQFKVADMSDMRPGFFHHVMPLLSKFECNHCHGKPGGKGGFELSLFGSNPPADFETIAKGAKGRRVSVIAPETSLLLKKATLAIGHGGGKRFEKNSTAYDLMKAWIEGNMPAGKNEKLHVTHIDVLPKERVMPRSGQQQLNVVAYYSDGTAEDVTHLATFKTDENPMTQVDEHGIVSVLGQQGEFTTLVLFRGRVGTFRGTIPFGFPIKSMPTPRNDIDKAVFTKLKKIGIPPSEICNDETFLRRVTIDLAGRLPSLEETTTFLADKSINKRDKLIDRLLESNDFADYFASKWIHLLRNSRSAPEHRRGTFAFHNWIRKSFRENKPYDQFVREILTASGDVTQHPPATWYREVKSPENQVEDMSQMFLGIRITCARCHHHPYEKWSQKDYYQLTAFFSQVKRKVSVEGNPSYYEERIYHARGIATAKHPVTGEKLKPAGLGAQPLEIPAEDDPRHRLVDWMTEKENPYFAAMLVNRYWKHFFGRGIVSPEDDMRETNPPTNPELLKVLSQQFIASKYDVKKLLKTICQSKTYQLSVQSNGYNLSDDRFFSRFQPRRMNAEVVLDSIDDVLLSKTTFSRLPLGTRAVQLPDSSRSGKNELLKLFGKPESQSACECERSQEGDLRQSLYFVTSSNILSKLSSGQGRAQLLVTDKKKTDQQIVDEIYLRALSRHPHNNEKQIALKHLETAKNRKTATENILWAIINTKEFLYNH